MDEGHRRGEGNRIVARGEHQTVYLEQRDDGSWLIEGVDERPVLLTREVMLLAPQNVQRREKGQEGLL